MCVCVCLYTECAGCGEQHCGTQLGATGTKGCRGEAQDSYGEQSNTSSAKAFQVEVGFPESYSQVCTLRNLCEKHCKLRLVVEKLTYSSNNSISLYST